jgi:hypothetical protein
MDPEDEDFAGDNDKDLDPDEEDKASMQKALRSKACFILSGQNKFRLGCVWLTQFPWFDRIILFLILVNCIILGLQTPIGGPAVRCTNEIQFGNGMNSNHSFNCGPPLVASDAKFEDKAFTELFTGSRLLDRKVLWPKIDCTLLIEAECQDDPSDSTKRHESGCYWDDGSVSNQPKGCKNPDCQACQLEGKCSCRGPLEPGTEFANIAAVTEMFFTIAFTFEATVKIISYGFIGHKGSYLRCAPRLTVLASFQPVVNFVGRQERVELAGLDCGRYELGYSNHTRPGQRQRYPYCARPSAAAHDVTHPEHERDCWRHVEVYRSARERNAAVRCHLLRVWYPGGAVLVQRRQELLRHGRAVRGPNLPLDGVGLELQLLRLEHAVLDRQIMQLRSA